MKEGSHWQFFFCSLRRVWKQCLEQWIDSWPIPLWFSIKRYDAEWTCKRRSTCCHSPETRDVARLLTFHFCGVTHKQVRYTQRCWYVDRFNSKVKAEEMRGLSEVLMDAFNKSLWCVGYVPRVLCCDYGPTGKFLTMWYSHFFTHSSFLFGLLPGITFNVCVWRGGMKNSSTEALKHPTRLQARRVNSK